MSANDELVERVRHMAEQQAAKHRFWHVATEQHSMRVLVSPAMDATEMAAEYRGCECRPMTDEEVEQWHKG